MATRAQRRAAAKAQAATDAQTADSFENFNARLGVGSNANNIMAASSYTLNPLTRNRQSLDMMYRGSWIIAVAVDCVADDMCRAGIDFESDVDPDDSETLQHAFKQLHIWKSLADTLRWSRLYGGAIAVLMIDGQNIESELDPSKIGPGQFKGLYPIDRWQLKPSISEMVTEFGPDYGKPEYYEVVADQSVFAGFRSPLMGKKIHHSRIFRFEGAPLPFYQRCAEFGWGMSIIERIYDRLVAFDSATQGGAQLIFKAHLRTLKVKGLRQILAGGGDALKILEANVEQIRKFQSTEGLTLVDVDDELESQAYGFNGLSEMIMQFGQQISGAIQVPLVRLFGQSPAGLNSTGESDWRMYYDGIASDQETDLRIPITKIVEIMHLSELKKPMPEGFGFAFSPLWQMTNKEKAEYAGLVTTAVTTAERDGTVSHAVALQELRKSSQISGVFTSITDKDIKDAENEPPDISGMELDPRAVEGIMQHPDVARQRKLEEMAAKAQQNKNGGPNGKAKSAKNGKDESIEDRNFNPAQIRIPKGAHEGGQWTRGTSTAKLKSLAERLKAEGGFTYALFTGSSPRPGQHAKILSPYPEREYVVDVDKLTAMDLARFAINNVDLLGKKGHYFGGWVDEGKAYIDVSIVTHSEQVAENLCHVHKQKAYFDLDTGQSVYVKGARDEEPSDLRADAWVANGAGN